MSLHQAAAEFAEAFQTSAGDIDAKLEVLLDVLEEKEMRHYNCGYCGFSGKYMHGCVDYFKTLKMFKEMRG